MTINSSGESSTYTNAAYSSKGFSGLASGIDTESLVQSMLSGIQNKIDKQTQNQKTLEYKQEAYRSVIKDINEFQSKYLNLTSPSCIRLASLYGSTQAESSSKAVSVTTGADSMEGDFSMQVARLATKTSVTSAKSSQSKSIQTVSGKADSFEYNRNINIKLGDSNEVAVDLKGVSDINEACARINSAVGSNVVSTSDSVVCKDSNGKVLTQKFSLGGSDYTGNVKIKMSYTGKDEGGNDIALDYKDGKYFKAGTDEEYTGESTASAKYFDESGNELDVKYFKGDEEVNASDVKTSANVTTSLIFNSSSEFEISGSSVGMAILGLSGTVKSTELKDENGNGTGKFEVRSTGFNENFAQVGKANGSVDVVLDGVKKSFAVKEGGSMADLQKDIQKAFGNAVEFTKGADGNWSISVNGQGRQFSMSANADTMEALGFAEGTKSVSNTVSRSDSLEKLGVIPSDADPDAEFFFSINGTEIKYTAKDTVSSIMNKINSSDAGVKMTYDDLGDKFSITSKSTGEGFGISLSGDDNGLFSKLGFGISASGDFDSVKAGQNALMTINGNLVERSSNTFTYNDMSITLKGTTGTYEKDASGNFVTDSDGSLVAASGTFEQKAEITTTKNVDKIVDTLKSFVEDYNKLIENLNKQIHADPSYKEYPPLTDAQKKEMSEKEIELWEEKSKEGILRGDKDISSFLSDMRSAMYTKGDSKYVLSNIGINSSSQWSDFGKLSIDEDELRKAIQGNSQEIVKLFTGENGLATRLNKICDKCANTSSGSPGALVQIAGVEGKGTEKDNQIKNQLDSIKERLSKLNLTYETRKERYWKMFNAMEQAISNMNSQGDQLSNFFM